MKKRLLLGMIFLLVMTAFVPSVLAADVVISFSDVTLNAQTQSGNVIISLDGYENITPQTPGVLGLKVYFSYNTEYFEIVPQSTGKNYFSPENAVIKPEIFYLDVYPSYTAFVYGDPSMYANMLTKNGELAGFTLQAKPGVFVPAGTYPISFYTGDNSLEVNCADYETLLRPVTNVSVKGGSIVVTENIDRRMEKAVVLQIDQKNAIVNDEIKALDVPAQIVNSRTLVPVRFMSEAFGASVDWNGETRTVTLKTADGTEIVIVIDSAVIRINHEMKTIDVPAQIISDRTMLPLRVVAEALGKEVYWNGDSRLIILSPTAFYPSTEEIQTMTNRMANGV